MEDKFKWNIPNILSLYRILVSPFIAFMVYSGKESAFTIFFVISLVTDILDGYIARRFNMQTKAGARLDSLGDIFNVVLGIAGMLRFHYNDINNYMWMFYVMIGLYVLVWVVSVIKFKKYSSLHLYSSKVTGYFQGIFFFVLFCFGFYLPMLWIIFLFSSISYSEEIIVLLMLQEEKSNVKGLYWVWKQQ